MCFENARMHINSKLFFPPFSFACLSGWRDGSRRRQTASHVGPHPSPETNILNAFFFFWEKAAILKMFERPGDEIAESENEKKKVKAHRRREVICVCAHYIWKKLMYF